MKKMAIVLVICIALSVLAGGAVLAQGPPSGAGAEKMPLYNSEDYIEADGATDTSDGPYGFTIINTDNASGYLVVQVALKGALANTEYIVYVNQVDAGSIIYQTRIGDDEEGLSTNRKGNGNIHVQDERKADADQFWVSVLDVGHSQWLRTLAVVLD